MFGHISMAIPGGGVSHFHNVCVCNDCAVVLFVPASQGESVQSGQSDLFDNYTARLCDYVSGGMYVYVLGLVFDSIWSM